MGKHSNLAFPISRPMCFQQEGKWELFWKMLRAAMSSSYLLCHNPPIASQILDIHRPSLYVWTYHNFHKRSISIHHNRSMIWNYSLPTNCINIWKIKIENQWPPKILEIENWRNLEKENLPDLTKRFCLIAIGGERCVGLDYECFIQI